MTQVRLARYAACAAALLAAACARTDETSTARAADGTDTSTASGYNTGTPTFGTTTRSPARDADQEFLREMVDHHQGLIDMASAARTQASTTGVQDDAQRIHEKQAEEQQEMLTLLQREYGDSITPSVLAASRGRMDTLRNTTSSGFDRSFYTSVIAHHREGVQMIDRTLPRLARSDVKDMAERMKSDMEKEIQDLQKKMQ